MEISKFIKIASKVTTIILTIGALNLTEVV